MMKNKKGFGLVGFLIVALLVALAMTFVLKQYAGMMRLAAPPPAAGKANKNAAAAKPAPCNGKKIGNICLPAQMPSSQDDFERMHLGN